MRPIPQETIHAAARTYGVGAEQLSYFAGGRPESDGVLFRYEVADGERLLKFLEVSAEHPEDLRRFEERIRFMGYLGAHGARVACPLFSPNGHLFEQMTQGNSIILVYCMERRAGRAGNLVTPQKRPEFFERWGALVGRMHACARKYDTWQGVLLPGSGNPIVHWSDEWRAFHGWLRDAEVRSIWEQLGHSLKALPVERDCFGFTHNDPHPWNLLVDGERLTVLDFDVANCHWFINDIAIALNGANWAYRNADRVRLKALFMDRFMAGYESENHLAPEWIARLDLFLLYRSILSFAVFYDQMQGKPEALSRWKQRIARDHELTSRGA